MGYGKRLLLGLPIAAALLAWQFYSKGEESKETKAKMLQMCEGDATCIAAVNQHAEACFDENYKMKRRNTGVDMDAFVACVNQRSGTTFFESVPAE